MGKANWIVNGDIFGIYVCSECCVIGTIVPSSGWGSSSSHEMTCQGCGKKKKCHLMSQSDLTKIKTALRDFKIGLLGI